MFNIKKRLTIKILIVFFAVLLACTFFSRSIVYFVTPKVTVGYPSIIDSTLQLPKYVLIGESSVYIVKMEKKFFREALYIELVNIDIIIDDGYMLEVEGISSDDLIVTGWDRGLTNGCRVMLPLR